MPFLPDKFCELYKAKWDREKKKNAHSNNPLKSNKRKGSTLGHAQGRASTAIFFRHLLLPKNASLSFFFFTINLVFSLHGTAVPAATHQWERGKSVFLVEFHGGVCWRPKKFQSHSSLKSYTEYWLPPGWLPRRDVVEFAGDCRRALLVGGCEEVEDEDEEAEAAGGGRWDERALLGAPCMRNSAAMAASWRSL